MPLISKVYNKDCMEAMAKVPDKYFELAIVDPPYGIGVAKNPNKGYRKRINRLTEHIAKDWDNKIPDKIYFDELQRVSLNQIIWGGNYFAHLLPPKPAWICYDKLFESDLSFSDFELAWTSFGTRTKKVRISYKLIKNNSTNKRNAQANGKIHPTQKPIQLYKWLLKNYAKQGDKILDTHLGSGSSRIAAYDMGFDFWGIELDKDYFDASIQRFEKHIRQIDIFNPNKAETLIL